MGNMKETHNVFLGFFFQKHFLCFHGKNPLEMLSSEFGRRCQVQSRVRCWLQLVGCAALLMDASNFGGPDRVGKSGVKPRRSLGKARVS